MLLIEPRPSTRARALLVLTYLVACAGLVAYVPAMLAVIPALAGAVALVREWHLSRPPPCVECRAGGEWWIEDDGPWSLQRASVLTMWLVLLVLHDGRRTVRVPLLPDSLPAEQWRRLRAALRQGTGEGIQS